MAENSALFLLLKSKLFQKRTDSVSNVVSPQIFVSTVYFKPEVVILAYGNQLGFSYPLLNCVISTFVFEKSFDSQSKPETAVFSAGF